MLTGHYSVKKQTLSISSIPFKQHPSSTSPGSRCLFENTTEPHPGWRFQGALHQHGPHQTFIMDPNDENLHKDLR